MLPKRRVLGDITNSTSLPEDESKKQKPASRGMFGGLLRAPTAPEPPASFLPPPAMAPAVLPPSDPVSRGKVAPAVDRSYMAREIDDIDSRDHGNPLLSTGIVNELYAHFRELERQYAVPAGYMAGQEAINEKMRCILVDWLVEVHLKFKMLPETLYIAVQVIDRYLAKKPVRRSKLQLVGVSALLVAAKYEEIFPPELKELVYITDRAYSKAEILEMEADILTALDYRLTLPTVHSFLCRFLKAAHADRPMVQLSCYLTERSLQEYGMLAHLPSQIAAAAVMVARMTLKRHPWSPTLLQYTGYDEADLADCLREMHRCCTGGGGGSAGAAAATAGQAQQAAVYRKYSSSKFGAVAKVGLVFKA